jgi:two-component system phosphate regulon sensor histidine kinase PhoR
MEYQFKINKFMVSEQYNINEMHINGNHDAISEALINLLSNATKYSGEIRKVDILLDAREDSYFISVKDYGHGIPKDELNNIFIPFFRIKDRERDKAGGAGLGLAIVKYIVDSHKGRVEVESKEGEGSKFTLLFPIGSQYE